MSWMEDDLKDAETQVSKLYTQHETSDKITCKEKRF